MRFSVIFPIQMWNNNCLKLSSAFRKPFVHRHHSSILVFDIIIVQKYIESELSLVAKERRKLPSRYIGGACSFLIFDWIFAVVKSVSARDETRQKYSKKRIQDRTTSPIKHCNCVCNHRVEAEEENKTVVDWCIDDPNNVYNLHNLPDDKIEKCPKQHNRFQRRQPFRWR